VSLFTGEKKEGGGVNGAAFLTTCAGVHGRGNREKENGTLGLLNNYEQGKRKGPRAKGYGLGKKSLRGGAFSLLKISNTHGRE